MSIPFLYALMVGGTAVGAIASYHFKRASSSITGINIASLAALSKNKRFLLGVILYLAAAANNIFVLKYMDYSIILPLASLTYIWTMILASRLLGETITKRKIFGVAAIIAGAILLANG